MKLNLHSCLIGRIKRYKPRYFFDLYIKFSNISLCSLHEDIRVAAVADELYAHVAPLLPPIWVHLIEETPVAYFAALTISKPFKYAASKAP